MGDDIPQKSIKDILAREDNRDYSGFITNPSTKQDDRPFWLRLLCSVKPAIFFSTKKIPKSSDDIQKGIKFKISGGTDF